MQFIRLSEHPRFLAPSGIKDPFEVEEHPFGLTYMVTENFGFEVIEAITTILKSCSESQIGTTGVNRFLP